MKNIMIGIVDNDMKGNGGRGTVFYMNVTEGDRLIERHEWGLLEELAGKFDRTTVAAPYHAENKLKLDAERKQQTDEKKAEKQARVDEVQDDPKLITLITDVIAANPKIVEQVKAGKDKAANALVGQIIGKIKSSGERLEADPLQISVLLNKCLSVTN